MKKKNVSSGGVFQHMSLRSGEKDSFRENISNISLTQKKIYIREDTLLGKKFP